MSKGFRQYQTWRLPLCLSIEFLLISSSIMLIVITYLSISKAMIDSSILVSSVHYWPHAFLTALVCQLSIYYADLYESHVALSPRTLLMRLGQAQVAATVALMVLFYIIPPLSFGRKFFILGLTLSFLSLFVWRLLYQRYTLNHFRVNVLILGTGHEAQDLAKELQNHHMLGYELRGFIGKSDEIGTDILLE